MSLEQIEIVENSKQNFSLRAHYMFINLVPRALPLKTGGAPFPPSREKPWERGCIFMFQNGLDGKDENFNMIIL